MHAWDRVRRPVDLRWRRSSGTSASAGAHSCTSPPGSWSGNRARHRPGGTDRCSWRCQKFGRQAGFRSSRRRPNFLDRLGPGTRPPRLAGVFTRFRPRSWVGVEPGEGTLHPDPSPLLPDSADHQAAVRDSNRANNNVILTDALVELILDPPLELATSGFGQRDTIDVRLR